MTNKDKLLELAARVSQLKREVEAIGKDKGVSLSASHAAGVIQSYCNSLEKQLMSLSERV